MKQIDLVNSIAVYPITMPALARIFLLIFATRPDILRAVKLVFSLYRFWNLDFFSYDNDSALLCIH